MHRITLHTEIPGDACAGEAPEFKVEIDPDTIEIEQLAAGRVVLRHTDFAALAAIVAKYERLCAVAAQPLREAA